jgi:hypothetical protein
MKGQTQAVTAVMITGIVMGGIGTAYLWGVPMLEKRQVEQDVTTTEEDVLNLRDEIESVSQRGSGASSSVTIDADTITVDNEDEYIQITNQLDQSADQGFTWSLLDGEGYQNLSWTTGATAIEGEDTPGVVAFQSIAGEGSSEITYRVEFRNMCSESTGDVSKVDLEADGQTRGTGSVTITLTNDGEEVSDTVIPDGACEGRTTRTTNLVDVQLG